MPKEDILIIENLSDFEKKINQDHRTYDINMMVMPGTLEEKHKDVDPVKGIRPLRRKFNLIYILLGGVHDVYLGADYRWLTPNDLVIVPENMAYASKNVRSCKGFCMHFKTEFIQPILSKPLTEEFPFLHMDAEHIINVSAAESLNLQESFRDIIKEYDRFSPEKDYILRNYIHILLLRIREIYRPYINQINQTSTRSMKITSDFKRLVEKNFIETREVSRYAEMLFISPKHLSEVVKENTGRTPRDFISEMLLLESKVLLASTNLTMTEIAHRLKFNDQSHFNHFIKQHTEYSPLELRKKL